MRNCSLLLTVRAQEWVVFAELGYFTAESQMGPVVACVALAPLHDDNTNPCRFPWVEQVA